MGKRKRRSKTKCKEQEELPPPPSKRKKNLTLHLEALRPHVTCSLCNLFFHECRTLIECLHSFCGGCLENFFAEYEPPDGQSEPYGCPTCKMGISGGNPIAKAARADLQKQGFVNQIRRLLNPKPKQDVTAMNQPHKSVDVKNLINFILIYNPGPNDPPGFGQVDKAVTRTPRRTTIGFIKKHICLKLANVVRPSEIEIICENENLGNQHSIEFVRRTRWFIPYDMLLYYRYKCEVDFESGDEKEKEEH